MIGLAQVLDEQKNLNKLCANRGNPTVDRFRGNGFYGMADVYKTYARIPVETPLNGVVPHGPYLSDTWLWKAEAKANLPYIYCYPEFRQAVYKRHTNKKIVLSACPFIYIEHMLKDELKPERNGTLFFPVHSSKCVSIQQDYNKLADKLVSIDEKYQPIDVCIYWRDYLAGAAEPFLQRGLRVVSAGHIYDRLFLYRLYHLLSQYQYASGNKLGSHLFYTVRSGCSYFNIDFSYKFIASPRALRENCEDIKAERRNEINQIFEMQTQASTEKQQDMVNYYLGAAYFKTREELRREILR